MSSAPAGPHWWATRPSGISWRARVATATIAIALVAVSTLVWTSPGRGDTVIASPEEELRAQVAALEEELALLESVNAEAARPRAYPSLPVDDADQEEQEDAADEEDDAAEPDAEADGRSAGPPPTARGSAGRDAQRPRPAPQPAAPQAPATSDGPANARNPVLPGPDAPPKPAPSPSPTTAPQQPADPTPTPAPSPTEPAITAPAKAELVHPDTRYYGMYTTQSPFNWAEFDDVAVKTGVLPNLAGYFQGWDKPFRADAVERSWQRGMLPLLTWESRPSGAANDQRTEADYSLPLILDGTYDDYLRTYAREIAELGLPVVIRLNHEMNGDWYPWSELTKEGNSINGNRPGDFAKTWRHIHDIFAEEGADDEVIWLWAPNITNNLPETLRRQEDLERLYPGDEYVDWVGLSGYFRPPYRDDQTPTFEYTFDQSLEQLRALADKPVLLAEIGASEVGGQKPEWIRSLFEGLSRPENDDVIGLAWFNLTITSRVRGSLVTNDWRVNSRASSLEAFREGLRLPEARMGGTPHP